LRPRDSDVEVLRHVFADKAYNLALVPQNARIMTRHDDIVSRGRKPIIIDAGANIGASPIWFAEKYPQAKIIAVEPDPSSAKIARRNCTLSNIQVVEAAIGSSSGKVRLAKSHPSSIAVKVVRDEGADVPVVTIPDLMAEYGEAGELLMVKIDIEGFEKDLFSKNTSWIDDVQAIIVEPHDWLFPGQFSSLPMQKALLDHNFEMLVLGENLIFVR
jgi:FkbM family methyltransferase